MHIAIDANVLEAPWGGVPKYVDRLVREMVQAGDRVDLLANTRRLGHQIPGAHEVGVRIKGLPIWREAFVPMWLARRRPDVLWAPASILPRRTPGASVATIHDLATVRFPGTKSPSFERDFARTVRRSAARATRVITISHATAIDLRELWAINLAHVRVVPCGVDDRFTPGNIISAQAMVRRRWGIERPFVLHVGSIEPRKGLDVLIDAASRAADHGDAWRLVLAGAEHPLGAATIRRARASGVCDLLGPVDDDSLLELYRAAGAVAAPALYEGFGLPPLEAMACETPVVIADGSGGLVEVSREASIVVNERTPEAWQHGIALALQRPAGLIAEGLALARGFSWSSVAAKTRAVLAEAAAGTRVRDR